MKALIVVDYTVDFIVGKLPCGQPGVDIEERVLDITEEFAHCGDYVVMAVDLHEENDLYHPETKIFEPHNIRNTEGRELYGKLNEWYSEHQHEKHVHWLDKTRYSAFCGTDLELRLRAMDIQEVHIIGVCTDICVLHTAIDAYNRGFTIVVHADAVASFNLDGHLWALGHCTQVLGAEVVSRY